MVPISLISKYLIRKVIPFICSLSFYHNLTQKYNMSQKLVEHSKLVKIIDDTHLFN